MARKPKGFADPAKFDHDNYGKAGGSLPKGPLTVTVTVGGVVHDGKGGTFPDGAEIPVTAEQAEGLKRQGYAQ